MPEYTDHVLRMTEARHKALSARIAYDALKKEVDLVRTYEASRRYAPSRPPPVCSLARVLLRWRCAGLRAEGMRFRRDAGRRRS